MDFGLEKCAKITFKKGKLIHLQNLVIDINTLWTSDPDLRLYITTVQDGWRKSAFLTRAWFPRTIHLIMQCMEPFSEWSCWRMFIETWPHSKVMVCEKYREQTALFSSVALLCF